MCWCLAEALRVDAAPFFVWLNVLCCLLLGLGGNGKKGEAWNQNQMVLSWGDIRWDDDDSSSSCKHEPWPPLGSPGSNGRALLLAVMSTWVCPVLVETRKG